MMFPNPSPYQVVLERCIPWANQEPPRGGPFDLKKLEVSGSIDNVENMHYRSRGAYRLL